MWSSYHVYNIPFNCFLEKLIQLYEYNYVLFYTVYTDLKGAHFRIRIKLDAGEEGIDNLINNLFGEKNVERRIYDPEKLKYGDFLKNYEKHSIIFCRWFVKITDKSKHNNTLKLRSKIAYCYLKSCLNFFQVNDNTQRDCTIEFWNKNSLFFQNKTTIDREGININVNGIDKDISNLFSFDIYPENIMVRRKLCFYLVHMALNRLNFNLEDEILLYYYSSSINFREDFSENS
ncbi:lantibiotic dehydratase C-terminal domain-containing protein [Streptococcus sobrinus]|mgnify:CR=1 FL=1|uniref:lantibiotic dehydratase C-terminal domain-containing protein n=1 Tax=Streptococcus sobrinus TaxID=1310 RepID=UPI00030B2AA5|nr:lantibiotic dehydratase C-terminal domain-containing protein [Streptococcus sobrinus]